MLASLEGVHAFRGITLLLTVILCATLPAAIGTRNRLWYTWLLLAYIELNAVGAIIAVADHWNDENLILTRAPRIFLADLFGLCYVGARLSRLR